MASVVGSVSMILSLAGSVAVFYVFGRYRFPLAPLLALFAGAGIVRALALYQAKNFCPVAIAALLLLCAGIVVNWRIIGVRGPGPGGYNNLANAYSKEGKVNQAIETAKLAIQLRPDYGVAHLISVTLRDTGPIRFSPSPLRRNPPSLFQLRRSAPQLRSIAGPAG